MFVVSREVFVVRSEERVVSSPCGAGTLVVCPRDPHSAWSFSFNPALRSFPPSHLGNSSKLDCPRFGVSSPFSFLLSHFSFLKAFSTCCACVFVLICLGVKMWVMVPVSSATKVVRRVPMYLRPHIDFSPHVPKIS